MYQVADPRTMLRDRFSEMVCHGLRMMSGHGDKRSHAMLKGMVLWVV